MIRRPPSSTRTDTLFPYKTLFRSALVRLALRKSAKAGSLKSAGPARRDPPAIPPFNSTGWRQPNARLRLGRDRRRPHAIRLTKAGGYRRRASPQGAGRVRRPGGGARQSARVHRGGAPQSSEEHTYELPPLMRISDAVFCLK